MKEESRVFIVVNSNTISLSRCRGYVLTGFNIYQTPKSNSVNNFEIESEKCNLW